MVHKNLIVIQGVEDYGDNERLRKYIHDNKYGDIFHDILWIRSSSILNKASYNQLITNIKKEKNNISMIITVDLFQSLCDKDPNEHMIVYDRLKELNKYISIYPSVKFLYDTGSKRYVLHREISKLMLPGTYVYPRDTQEINNLKKGNYVIKYGFTSTSLGINFINKKNGKQIITEINKKGVTASGAKCKDNIAMVQPRSELFSNCAELRLGIIGNKIIGIVTFHPRNYRTILGIGSRTGMFDNYFTNTKNIKNWMNLQELPMNVDDKNYINYMKSSKVMVRSHTIYSPELKIPLANVYYKDENYYYIIFKLNDKIYKFVKDAIKKINKIYPDNIFIRLDIIYECKSVEDFVGDHDIGDVYINEIEPYGSGNKPDMYTIVDNEKSGFIDLRRAVIRGFDNVSIASDIYHSVSSRIFNEKPCMIYDELNAYLFANIENAQLIKQILERLKNVSGADTLKNILQLLI